MLDKKSLEERQIDARLSIIALNPETILSLIITVSRDRPKKLVAKSDDRCLAYTFIHIGPCDATRNGATNPVCRLYEKNRAAFPSGGNCGGNAARSCTIDTNIRSHIQRMERQGLPWSDQDLGITLPICHESKLTAVQGLQFLSLLSSFALRTLSSNSRAFFLASFEDWFMALAASSKVLFVMFPGFPISLLGIPQPQL